MGILLNPDNLSFKEAINSEIYRDKTMLIELTNKVIQTKGKNICVSRPRRFGKSTTADMLTAYYSRGCDSKEIFDKYKICKTKNFSIHLNKYNVIHINMARFIRTSGTIEAEIDKLSKRLLFELHQDNPDVDCFAPDDLIDVLDDIFAQKKIPFIFIIDEWDCIFRMHKDDNTAHIFYLDFLRNLLKDQSYVALAYMTGILPIKKYGEHSALNMFTEISIAEADAYAEFTGFTETDVKDLCSEYDMPFDEIKRWYDGYNVNSISIYNPKSVVEAMIRHRIGNYWTKTETFEALADHIKLDYKNLHSMVTQLIAGEEIRINTAKFQNDMTSFDTADDILTLLIHLGYLTFRHESETHIGYGYVTIPNAEVRQEFINCIESDDGWANVMNAIKESDELLQEVLDGNTEAVAKDIEKCHEDNTSILKYNDENKRHKCVIEKI